MQPLFAVHTHILIPKIQQMLGSTASLRRLRKNGGVAGLFFLCRRHGDLDYALDS